MLARWVDAFLLAERELRNVLDVALTPQHGLTLALLMEGRRAVVVLLRRGQVELGPVVAPVEIEHVYIIWHSVFVVVVWSLVVRGDVDDSV